MKKLASLCGEIEFKINWGVEEVESEVRMLRYSQVNSC